MIRRLSLPTVAALLITVGLALPAHAGIRYIDRTPLIVQVQHHLLVERVTARRERIDEQRAREAAREARQAAAAVVAPTPPTYSPPASTYSGCLTAEQVASYARGAGFPESAISTMVAFAYRESHYCPGAVNSSSGACGLWQLYPCPGPDALDPARNAALAYSKYSAPVPGGGIAGFSPWGG